MLESRFCFINLFDREGFQVDVIEKISESELISAIPQYHAIGVRSKTQLTPAILTIAKRLLVIGCFCIGRWSLMGRLVVRD